MNLLGAECSCLFVFHVFLVLQQLRVENRSVFLVFGCCLSLLRKYVVCRLLVENDRLFLALRLQRNRLRLSFVALLKWRFFLERIIIVIVLGFLKSRLISNRLVRDRLLSGRCFLLLLLLLVNLLIYV